MSEAPPVRPTVYLDHAGAATPAAGLFRRWADLAATLAVNPHGTTRFSAECKRYLHSAENRLLQALGIPAGDARVVWTSGGTEAINLAVHGLLAKRTVKSCLVDGAGHAALVESCLRFAGQFGCACETAGTDGEGQMVAPRDGGEGPGLIAATQINNETGAIQDLVALRRAADTTRKNGLLLVDALQSVGKIAIPWREARIDLLALGGRKLGAPASLGALVVRRGIDLAPLMFGGGQQDGLRPGSLDTAAIVVLAEVVAERVEHAADDAAHVSNLRHLLLAGSERLAAYETRVLSPENASPYILCLSFPAFEGAVLVRLLGERGVVVGTGSACSAEAGKPSRVLENMGIGRRCSRGAIRVSFASHSSAGDVRRFLSELEYVLDNY